MKWFVIILSLYFFYLFNLPCVDTTSRCIQVNTVNIPHSHDHEGNDIPAECSPFCNCSCCSISVILTDFSIDLKPIEILHYSSLPIYKFSIANYITPVWQPPRLI